MVDLLQISSLGAFIHALLPSAYLASYIGFLVGSRAASFKRPLMSVDVSVCLFVHNFDAKQ